MRDDECVAFLQWALPPLGLHWPGFRRVRRQVCKRIAARSVPVVATVARRGAGFIVEVKRREDCELWTLTCANRDALPLEIINRTH